MTAILSPICTVISSGLLIANIMNSGDSTGMNFLGGALGIATIGFGLVTWQQWRIKK